MAWIEKPPKAAARPRVAPKLASERRAWSEQMSRWFRLCLDHQLMSEAIAGICKLTYRYNDGSVDTRRRARLLLYRYARAKARAWQEAYPEGALVAFLYATMCTAADPHYTIVVSSEFGQFLVIDWDKLKHDAYC